MTLLFYLGQLAYFMLPAYIANMMPVLGKSMLTTLAHPIDNKYVLGGKPLFGKNKTWRGLLLGIFGGMLTTFVQSHFTTPLNLVSYPEVWPLLGFTMGCGALLGDLAKSFFKRRLSILPGKQWVPFDQIDFVIGALLLNAFVYWPGWTQIGAILLMSFGGHVFMNRIGYWIKLKQTPW